MGEDSTLVQLNMDRLWWETTLRETEQRRDEGGDDSRSEINGDGQKKVTTEGERVRKCVKCRKGDDREDE